jgi:mannose-6-phosphate isomerase
MAMTDPLNLPLKLTPRFDPKPWGGRRLAGYGFDLPGDGPIGEAVITPADAVIAAGPLAGTPVREVVASDPARIIGERGLAATGDRALFPLLIKVIDAQADLSIQVHPDNDAASALGTLGKTETYHVLASEPGSRIALGLRPDVTPAAFSAACRAGKPTSDLLRWIPAHAGETILIPAGTVHALGAGCMVFEAQQPSEITYRLDDWGRLGVDGRPRSLHVEEGLAAYDPASRPLPITPLRLRSASGRRNLLTACQFFAVERIALARGETAIATTSGSPQTLTVLRGGTTAATNDGSLALHGGDTAIVTAACNAVMLTATAPAVVLRTWVPDLEREVMAPALSGGHGVEQVMALSGGLTHLAGLDGARPAR